MFEWMPHFCDEALLFWLFWPFWLFASWRGPVLCTTEKLGQRSSIYRCHRCHRLRLLFAVGFLNSITLW